MNQEEEILKQTYIQEEKPQISLAEKLKEQKLKRRKKMRRRAIIFILFAFFSYAVWFLFKPFKASEAYGICYTFLELTVPYPHTLYVSEVEDAPDNGGLRLWYTQTDAFGEYRMESFQCNLGLDQETGKLRVDEIKLHKVNLDPERVKNLNNALVYFEENPLILNYPSKLPDSIEDLHLEFDAFRRIQLNSDKYR